MTRTVIRAWTLRGVTVATVHPQVGELHRGRIASVRGVRDGAGAFGVWELTDADHEVLPLLVVGDYLTAEQVLLDATTWADEPIPDDELDN